MSIAADSSDLYLGDDIQSFVEFVLTKKNVTFIAHNGRAYDTWMVHQYLIKQTKNTSAPGR